jgi:RimJ/RimL family protein N-acetyltransferase
MDSGPPPLESRPPFPPERVDAGPVLLRRLRPDDAEAIAEAVAASLAHLRPWMFWATAEATDPVHQRARITDAEASWEAGTDYIYSARLNETRGGGAAHGAETRGEEARGEETRGGQAHGGACCGTRCGEILGSFGLHRRSGPDSIEIGYWVHAAHAGRGYATAAARALTQVALALPGVLRVEIHCDAANVASAAIPRKLGYRLDRIEDREPQAPSETGRLMIWVLDRHAASPP